MKAFGVARVIAVLVICSFAADAQEKPLTRIAFASCINQKLAAPIPPVALEVKSEVFIFLGDNIYADDELELKKTAYAQLGASEAFNQLRKSARILATWDDHDFGGNDGGGDYPHREASQKLFLDFFHEPADSPRRKRPGVYDAYVFGPPGQRVQVILLDTRYFRSPLKEATDPASVILNEEQWAWLAGQLKVPAELRVIVSSIQVLNEDPSGEKWSRFPHQRQRLFKLLADGKANGVVFVSGDRHFGEISSMKVEGLPYRLVDVTSSALSAAPVKPRERPNPNRVGEPQYVNNLGLITVEWQPEPRVTLQVLGLDGKPLLGQTLKLGDLRGR